MAIMGRGKSRAEQGQNRVLDVTASMQGSLIFQEPVSLRISGRFQGTLQTKGDLTIGEAATVEADITGESITVAGKVTGKLIAKDSLTLVSPAVVTGEIWTPLLRVEEGARVDGEIHMDQQGQRMTTEGPQSGPRKWLSVPNAQTMTVEDVATYLEVDSRVVEGWARDGKIAGVQEKGRWLFEKAKIDNWVASQKSS